MLKGGCQTGFLPQNVDAISGVSYQLAELVHLLT
jgi:hypothetical protein